MDLHPEAEIAAGMLAERSVTGRVLAWLDARAYRGADFVVDLGAYMRERVLRKGVSPPRRTPSVSGAAAWSYRHERHESSNEAPRARRPLRRHVLGQCRHRPRLRRDLRGNAAASRRSRIFFLFVGDGPRRAEVEEFARREGLHNFTYRDYFPRDLLRYSLSIADVHLDLASPAIRRHLGPEQAVWGHGVGATDSVRRTGPVRDRRRDPRCAVRRGHRSDGGGRHRCRQEDRRGLCRAGPTCDRRARSSALVGAAPTSSATITA